MLGLIGLLACTGESSTSPRPEGATFVVTPGTLGAEITAMITAGWPKGHATAISAKWDQVLKAIAKEPKGVLKGHVVPGTSGRSELVRTVAFIQQKAAEATPPAGETREHFVARLVLDMSLYVYSGPMSVPPPLNVSSDVVLKVVSPATTDTVVTPAEKAAVIFPAGAATEPTVVVITPVEAYYAANCSGPLTTSLCQYPLFYHFNVFPDVKLNSPAKVQVCHVDNGSNRLPLADHDRFRIAHEKPASPTDYSAGSTIEGNTEVLALAIMDVTSCVDGGGTTYSPPPVGPSMLRSPIGALTDRAYRAVHRLAYDVRSALTPKSAYAIDAGGGGDAELFSIFGVVDPLGKQDLAQAPPGPTRFALDSSAGLTGSTLGVHAWSVTNQGSRTSGAFTSSLIVATDSLLTSIVSQAALPGGSSLVPAATYNYGATSVVLPATAGTYFVGTKVLPAAPAGPAWVDSSASNNLLSVRVTVASFVPVVAAPADLAVAPGFGIAQTTIMQGTSEGINGWSVENVGATAAGAFTSLVALASDTTLNNVLKTVPLGGAASLGVGASFPYGATLLPISKCVAPGSYFVGPRISPTGTDALTINNFTSQRITVTSMPAPVGQAPGSAAWSAAGPGTVGAQVNPQCVNLNYNFTPSGYAKQTFTFTTTAVATGAYTFNWTYGGLHSWYTATAEFEAFAVGPTGVATISLVSSSVYDYFGFSGATTLPLTAGYQWGVRAKGQHYDSSQILLGSITVSTP